MHGDNNSTNLLGQLQRADELLYDKRLEQHVAQYDDGGEDCYYRHRHGYAYLECCPALEC